MSCAAPSLDVGDLATRAYRARRELYLAAGLEVADDVRAPDRRFAEAMASLGRAHPDVRAAVDARNALAATAEPIVVAIAAAFARKCKSLRRNEAEQEGRIAAARAAELWSPAGGASFRTYVRKWIRKYVSGLADCSRSVSIPERCRIAGERIEMVDLDPVRCDARSELEVLEEQVAAEAEVERLDRALAELPPIEREVLAREFSGAPRAASAADLGVDGRTYSLALKRGLERLRHQLAGGPAPSPSQLDLLSLR